MASADAITAVQVGLSAVAAGVLLGVGLWVISLVGPRGIEGRES